jgi:putative oxidoreductase
MENLLWYLGRAIFGGYFLFSGYSHFANLDMMSGYARSKGVPAAKLAVAGTGVLLLAAGLSILLNVYPVVGLAAAIVFLVPTSLMMHAFWKVRDAGSRMGETVNFTKNMAIVGALLILLFR